MCAYEYEKLSVFVLPLFERAGTGSEIRTHEYRSQSPVPYRLAIPVYKVPYFRDFKSIKLNVLKLNLKSKNQNLKINVSYSMEFIYLLLRHTEHLFLILSRTYYAIKLDIMLLAIMQKSSFKLM